MVLFCLDVISRKIYTKNNFNNLKKIIKKGPLLFMLPYNIFKFKFVNFIFLYYII